MESARLLSEKSLFREEMHFKYGKNPWSYSNYYINQTFSYLAYPTEKPAAVNKLYVDVN